MSEKKTQSFPTYSSYWLSESPTFQIMTSAEPADVSSKPSPDLGLSCDPDEDAICDPDLSVGAAELSSLERVCRRQLSSASGQPAERRARLHNRLGLLLYGQVRFDEAAREYTAALQACPRLAAAAYNRGIVRYRMGKTWDTG